MRAKKGGCGLYILVARTAVPEPDYSAWMRWCSEHWHTGERDVGRDHVGPILVSTVFIGIDHNFGFRAPPLLFETGVLIEPEDGQGLEMLAMRRYETWDEAEKGHRVALRYARMRLWSANKDTMEMI